MSDTTGNGALINLLRAGVLDAELAALLWLLVEARVPVVVAGRPVAMTAQVRDALLALLPDDTRPLKLRGAEEDFDWMPEAADLGWRHDRAADAVAAAPHPDRGSTVLIADLADRPAGGTWGERARVAIRSLSVGYGMAATADGDRLEDVLGRLAGSPVGATDDELTGLGVVLLVRPGPSDQPRIAAAHYVRPVARDEHGHVQRMPPAVLATWNPGSDRFDHFAWGVTTELAIRVGRSPIELEREQARRARDLAALAASPS